jgi:hypothetical protein
MSFFACVCGMVRVRVRPDRHQSGNQSGASGAVRDPEPSPFHSLVRGW